MSENHDRSFAKDSIEEDLSKLVPPTASGSLAEMMYQAGYAVGSAKFSNRPAADWKNGFWRGASLATTFCIVAFVLWERGGLSSAQPHREMVDNTKSFVEPTTSAPRDQEVKSPSLEVFDRKSEDMAIRETLSPVGLRQWLQTTKRVRIPVRTASASDLDGQKSTRIENPETISTSSVRGVDVNALLKSLERGGV